MRFLRKLLIKSPVLIYDCAAIPVAWFLAYWLRHNLSAVDSWVLELAVTPVFIVIAIQMAGYYYFKLYRGVWCFTSLNDLMRIMKSVVAATLLSVAALYFSSLLTHIPRSVIPVYAVCLIGLLTGGRVSVRYFREQRVVINNSQQVQRVLIIGAGCAGERLLRDIQRHGAHKFMPVGFVDDASTKQGVTIHGVRVLEQIAQLRALVESQAVDIIFLAIPSLSSQRLRQIVKLCEGLSLPVRTLPSLAEIVAGQVSINALREISINDLLGRAQVQLDRAQLASMVAGKRVLVTGAGGSIGSELCRQLALLAPACLCVVDHSEFNLYQLDGELASKFPNMQRKLALVNVTDKAAVNTLLGEFKPQLIFHAAAYKHVPMLESQVRIALKNNVLGTRVVAEAALINKVEQFILISTDKAVNPSNVMGVTKRLAEVYCQQLNDTSSTKFITVRFGNVLGSAGSVVPLFKQQLTAGGPLTVTHPDITRYFMTIPEACQLILQSASQGEGGEIFVLDMGEPIKITYLAEQMIRLAGKTLGDDIEIVYTGLRPGEKLYEELFYQQEQLLPTSHSKIMKAKRVIDSKSKKVLERLQHASFDIDSISNTELSHLIQSIRKQSAEIKNEIAERIN